MKKNPLVSVIIAAYNEERYIASCLSSLIDQTYKNIEIIVVDDGSIDNTCKVVSKYAVTLIKSFHSGPAHARNTGASRAKGEIFVFLDADMRYDTEYVEKLIAPILTKNVVGTFNKEEYVANTENIWARCWAINSDLSIHQRAPEELPDELGLFRAIQRDAFVRINGYDPLKGYFDDGTLATKLVKNAVSAQGARAYHFNPETLFEVFYSSRWIGRGMQERKSLNNFLRYSPINSLRNGVRKVMKKAPVSYIVFKIVYDTGMFTGIFLSRGRLQK